MGRASRFSLAPLPLAPQECGASLFCLAEACCLRLFVGVSVAVRARAISGQTGPDPPYRIRPLGRGRHRCGMGGRADGRCGCGP